MPFRQGRKGSGVKTLKLSPYGSDLFGLDVDLEEAFLGIPSILWDICLSVRWEAAVRLSGEPDWLYLVMVAGPRNTSTAIGMRIRHRRLDLLSGRESLTLVPMDDQGAFLPSGEDRMSLVLKEVDAPYWEGHRT